MKDLQSGIGARLSLPLDPILASILAALIEAGPNDAAMYLEKAHWLYENIPLDVLKQGLGGK